MSEYRHDSLIVREYINDLLDRDYTIGRLVDIFNGRVLPVDLTSKLPDAKIRRHAQIIISEIVRGEKCRIINGNEVCYEINEHDIDKDLFGVNDDGL